MARSWNGGKAELIYPRLASTKNRTHSFFLLLLLLLLVPRFPSWPSALLSRPRLSRPRRRPRPSPSARYVCG